MENQFDNFFNGLLKVIVKTILLLLGLFVLSTILLEMINKLLG